MGLPDSKRGFDIEAAEYRSKLWKMADALRGSIDAAEYKHVVLGLIFLKYVSDAFAERRAELEAQAAEFADPEDPDEYRSENVFWVPPEARWETLAAEARQPTIGVAVDDAMDAIERDNPALKGVLPRDHARQGLDKARLGQVVDMVTNIDVGGASARATDVLGSVYEYFLEQFAIEPPWFSWRVGLLVSNRLVVGSSGSVGRLELCGRDLAQVGV